MDLSRTGADITGGLVILGSSLTRDAIFHAVHLFLSLTLSLSLLFYIVSYIVNTYIPMALDPNCRRIILFLSVPSPSPS
jgi:hypothetical protein